MRRKTVATNGYRRPYLRVPGGWHTQRGGDRYYRIVFLRTDVVPADTRPWFPPTGIFSYQLAATWCGPEAPTAAARNRCCDSGGDCPIGMSAADQPPVC